MGNPISAAIEILPSNFVTAFPLCEVIATATDRPAITEIMASIYVNAAATIVIGLGRPGAVGVGAKATTTFAAEDGGNSSTPWLTIAREWTSPPTAPSIFMRRATLTGPATGGGFARWLFPDGLVVLPSNSLVLWCISATTAIGNIRSDVSFAADC